MVCCAFCKEEISVHEQKASEILHCPDCNKTLIINPKRNRSLTTARCKCGTLVYLEGKGEWSYYKNKG